MALETGTGKVEKLLERCRGLAPIPTAIAWPCDETSLAGALDAHGRRRSGAPIA